MTERSGGRWWRERARLFCACDDEILQKKDKRVKWDSIYVVGRQVVE